MSFYLLKKIFRIESDDEILVKDSNKKIEGNNINSLVNNNNSSKEKKLTKGILKKQNDKSLDNLINTKRVSFEVFLFLKWAV
jgi:hypothetical protein